MSRRAIYSKVAYFINISDCVNKHKLVKVFSQIWSRRLIIYEKLFYITQTCMPPPLPVGLINRHVAILVSINQTQKKKLNEMELPNCENDTEIVNCMIKQIGIDADIVQQAFRVPRERQKDSPPPHARS